MAEAGELKSYERLIAREERVKKVLTEDMATAIFGSNKSTLKKLEATWKRNLRKNIPLLKKHGSLADHFLNYGTNKAVIGVGAGPSFNLNKDELKRIYDYNIQFPFEEQPFIIIASNKQFKPLLEMGIYPHFTILIDAGDALYPQLCTDIPKYARQSILIAGLQCSPKILNAWDKQGGSICFFAIGDEEELEWLEKKTGYAPDHIHTSQGGNVLNTLWVLTKRFLGSSTYIMVGNDLSFKYSTDKAERRKSFYADGDYALNLANKHDDAKEELAWGGFEMQQSAIVPGDYFLNMKIMGTSRELWIYKTWMEVQATVWAEEDIPFIIYNCSEKGISGVIPKETTREAMDDVNNWYLIDELIPKRWRTRTLKQAKEQFIEALLWLRNQDNVARQGVISLPGAMPIARNTSLYGKSTRAGIIL